MPNALHALSFAEGDRDSGLVPSAMLLEKSGKLLTSQLESWWPKGYVHMRIFEITVSGIPPASGLRPRM